MIGRKKGSAGFTIVELVVVIIILGILAATALPRFLDVSEDAYASVVNGVRGSFASGVNIAKADWEAAGRPANNLVDIDDDSTNDIGVNSSGWPIDGGTIAAGADDCESIYNGLMGVNSPTIADTGAASDSTLAEAVKVADTALASNAGVEWFAAANNATPTQCYFIYLPEGGETGVYAAGFNYTLATGAVGATEETTVPAP